MADVGLIRKRLRAEIDEARRVSATRRERVNAATRAYETLLESIAIPAFRQLANILRAEGVPFDVQTPSGGIRLVSDRTRDDVIELALDTIQEPPQVVLITTRMRGGNMLRTERPIKDGAAIEAIAEDDLIERLIDELRPWLG